MARGSNLQLQSKTIALINMKIRTEQRGEINHQANKLRTRDRHLHINIQTRNYQKQQQKLRQKENGAP